MEKKRAFLESYFEQLFPEPEKIIYVNGSIYYPIGRVYVFKLSLNVEYSHNSQNRTIYGFSYDLLHRANGSVDKQYFLPSNLILCT